MARQKILLIRANPATALSEFLEHRSVCPPLGLMYLAAVLRERHPHDYEIRILDPGLDSMSVKDVGLRIEAERPDLIGISSLATELHDAWSIVRVARQAAPCAPVVMGGPCSQTEPRQIALDPDIHSVVLGEGEETFAELVPLALAGEPVDSVRGLCIRGEDGKARFTDARAAIEPLDDMPRAAWDLIDLPPYSTQVRSMNYGLLAAKPYAPIFTSRGCPWKCTYCHDLFGRRTRYRSKDNVLAEMEYLVEQRGVREFHFYDDIFNVDGRRAGEIMDAITERGWNVKLAFPNGVRGDILTEELIGRFARAGTYLMCFAVETASPRLQKLIKKNLKLEKIAENIGHARRAGIIPLGFFMLGFPSETTDEIRSTIDWACKSELLKAYFFTVVPFDGTPIAEGVRDEHPDFDFDPTVTYHAQNPYYTRTTGTDLNRFRNIAYARFYLNPSRLFGLFSRHPSKLQMAMNAAKGFTLVTLLANRFNRN